MLYGITARIDHEVLCGAAKLAREYCTVLTIIFVSFRFVSFLFRHSGFYNFPYALLCIYHLNRLLCSWMAVSLSGCSYVAHNGLGVSSVIVWLFSLHIVTVSLINFSM